jgi:hypothetical protein
MATNFPFLLLTPEVRLEIVDHLPPGDMSALCRTCSRLQNELRPYLYKLGAAMVFADGATAVQRCIDRD